MGADSGQQAPVDRSRDRHGGVADGDGVCRGRGDRSSKRPLRCLRGVRHLAGHDAHQLHQRGPDLSCHEPGAQDRAAGPSHASKTVE